MLKGEKGMSDFGDLHGWVASLSNGETVYEQSPIAEEPSSWQKLLQKLKSENLKITQMRLQHGKNTVIAFPKADGYMQAYEIRKALFSGKSAQYQGIGSVVGDLVFITWMNSTGESWQDVRKLSEVDVHTTL